MFLILALLVAQDDFRDNMKAVAHYRQMEGEWTLCRLTVDGNEVGVGKPNSVWVVRDYKLQILSKGVTEAEYDFVGYDKALKAFKIVPKKGRGTTKGLLSIRNQRLFGSSNEGRNLLFFERHYGVDYQDNMEAVALYQQMEGKWEFSKQLEDGIEDDPISQTSVVIVDGKLGELSPDDSRVFFVTGYNKELRAFKVEPPSLVTIRNGNLLMAKLDHCDERFRILPASFEATKGTILSIYDRYEDD